MMLRNLRDYMTIKKSGLFDHAYYLRVNQDVRLADIDPLMHFVRIGWREERNPSQFFDVHYYLSINNDVKESGINPLVHYIKYGRIEGRNPVAEGGNVIIDNHRRIHNIMHNKRLNRLSNIQSTIKHMVNLTRMFTNSLQKSGIVATLHKVKEHLFLRIPKFLPGKPLDWINNLTDHEIQAQRRAHFEKEIKFSIVIPLYNTPQDFLSELIQSVVNQTYSNWEICFADGSDINSNQIYETMDIWKNETRIHYRKLGANQGIALNTIAAYEMATGDYIVLMDHDDILTIDALFELALIINNFPDCDVLYSDRAIFSNETKEILAYHYLPGFSPDYLRSMNYMSHLIAYSNRILQQVGFERPGYDGSQDYELLLRCIEQTNNINHIAKVLYFCRASPNSVALNPDAKLYAYEAGKKAITEHIERIGFQGKVEFIKDLYAYRIHYQIKTPRISILIPNKDHVDVLRRCINSILSLSTYNNYEIAIVENNSKEESTFDYYALLSNDPRIRVIVADINEFNYSILNNFAVSNTNADYVILLNNDIEVITPSWIEEMLMFAQRQDVGAVGAKLLYRDKTIQHCGLVIGLGGDVANNFGYKKSNEEYGYMSSLVLPQNYSAVTAACLMVNKIDYLRVGGMDEQNFKIALNDMDFCLKLRELGLYNVWTPYAELYHYESTTRGSDADGKNKARYQEESNCFKEKWKKYFIDGDPFQRKNYKGW